jgi:hypothetical protein
MGNGESGMGSSNPATGGFRRAELARLGGWEEAEAAEQAPLYIEESGRR